MLAKGGVDGIAMDGSAVESQMSNRGEIDQINAPHGEATQDKFHPAMAALGVAS